MSQRIGCLETYCQVRENWRKNALHDSDALFSVEEDHRNRVYIQLVSPAKPSTSGSSNSASSTTRTSTLQWRCTDAVGSNKSKYSRHDLTDTMGTCILDWLVDGYNTLLLSLAPGDSGLRSPLLGDPGSNDSIVFSLLKELFMAKESLQSFKIGVSWWTVCGSEVRDHTGKAVVARGGGIKSTPSYEFDTLEIDDFADVVSVLHSAQERRKKHYRAQQQEQGLGDGSPSSVREDGSSGREIALHTFLRISVLKLQSGTLSVLNFVDLANRGEPESRKDLDALYEMLRQFSIAANERGSFDSSNSSGNWGDNMILESPNDLFQPSEQAAQVIDFTEEQYRRPICSLLSPLLTGNCKSFLLTTIPESRLSDRQMQEALLALDIAERSSLITTVTYPMRASQQGLAMSSFMEKVPNYFTRQNIQNFQINNSQTVSVAESDKHNHISQIQQAGQLQHYEQSRGSPTNTTSVVSSLKNSPATQKSLQSPRQTAKSAALMAEQQRQRQQRLLVSGVSRKSPLSPQRQAKYHMNQGVNMAQHRPNSSGGGTGLRGGAGSPISGGGSPQQGSPSQSRSGSRSPKVTKSPFSTKRENRENRTLSDTFNNDSPRPIPGSPQTRCSKQWNCPSHGDPLNPERQNDNLDVNVNDIDIDIDNSEPSRCSKQWNCPSHGEIEVRQQSDSNNSGREEIKGPFATQTSSSSSSSADWKYQQSKLNRLQAQQQVYSNNGNTNQIGNNNIMGDIPELGPIATDNHNSYNVNDQYITDQQQRSQSSQIQQQIQQRLLQQQQQQWQQTVFTQQQQQQVQQQYQQGFHGVNVQQSDQNPSPYDPEIGNIDELVVRYKRLAKKVKTLEHAKVTEVEYQDLQEKYEQIREQNNLLQKQLNETANEQLYERDLQIHDLQLQTIQLKKLIRTSAIQGLSQIDVVAEDASRNPILLFDELEAELTETKKELQAQKEKNTRLQLKMERLQRSPNNSLFAADTDQRPDGLPKFVRDLNLELRELKKREADFARSERSNLLVQKCVKDLSMKLQRSDTALKEERKVNVDLTTRSNAAETFLDKVLKKARANEKELDDERNLRIRLESQISGLKEACFYQTFHSRKEKILTKFLPINDVIRGGSGVARSFASERKAVSESFMKLHKELVSLDDSPILRSLIALSTRVKTGLNTLCRNHEKLEEQSQALVDLLKMRASESVGAMGNSNNNNGNLNQHINNLNNNNIELNSVAGSRSTSRPRANSNNNNITPRSTATTVLSRPSVKPVFDVSPTKSRGVRKSGY